MMKVTSLSGAATGTRNAMLQMLTQTASGSAKSVNAGAGPDMARPAAMAPPPRSSSFGGADPRAMFEALVQSFDSDSDGKLSLGEVNALNHGGLLARSFAKVDSNRDGTLTGDEIAASAPWGDRMLPSGDQGGGDRGADVRPLLDMLTDRISTTRDAGQPTGDAGAASVADFAQGYDRGGRVDTPGQSLTRVSPDLQSLAADPVTLMQSMVMGLSALGVAEDDSTRADAAQQAYTLR